MKTIISYPAHEGKGQTIASVMHILDIQSSWFSVSWWNGGMYRVKGQWTV